MATLSPTLVIGLGSTGLDIIDFFRDLLLEEFGTPDVPIIKCISFETNSTEQSKTGLPINSLTIDAVEAVRSRMTNEPNRPECIGYKQWLDPSVLNQGDSFKAGAGGVRAAGRLILWENWEDVSQVIRDNYDACTNTENLEQTKYLVQQHNKDQNIKQSAESIIANRDVSIYVVGTVCGGSCSGMFQDLGFLLRELYSGANRILITTVPTAADASPAKSRQMAANTYGALRELDFIYHRYNAGTWSYPLADGVTFAKENEDPYKLVYLVSQSNGVSNIGQGGVNQMIAMNLFLDVVGGGRTGKDGAIVDYGTVMSKRSVNHNNFVKFFFSFGLSAVWYPKSKITGLAACELGIKLVDGWIGKEGDIQTIELKNDAVADMAQLQEFILACINEEIDLVFTPFKQLAALQYDQLEKPLIHEIEEKAHGKLVNAISDTHDKLKEIRNKAAQKLQQLVFSRFYEDYRNHQKFIEYWKHIKHSVDELISQLTTQNAEIPPKMDQLDRIIALENACDQNPWLGVTFTKKKAKIFHRQRYLHHNIRRWETAIQSCKDYLLGVTARLLRIGEADRDLVEKYIPAATSTLNSIERKYYSEMDYIFQTKEELKQRQDRFNSLGGSKVVNEIFAHDSLANDISRNISEIYNASGAIRADSIEYHITKLNSENIDNPRSFWAQETFSLVETMIKHYQQEGLRHLPQPVKDLKPESLTDLARNAQPYLEMDAENTAVDQLRPSTFIFADYDQNKIREIAGQIGYSNQENQCRTTNLKHMMFFYWEDRLLPVDMIKAYKNCQNHGKQHNYRTHQDPHFFDSQRIENQYNAELLMVAAASFFSDTIFPTGDGQTDKKVYVFTNRGKREYFYYGNTEHYRKLAKNPAALARLEMTVKNACNSMEEKIFEKEYIAVQDNLNQKLHALDITDELAKQIDHRLALLSAFHTKYVLKETVKEEFTF